MVAINDDIKIDNSMIKRYKTIKDFNSQVESHNKSIQKDPMCALTVDTQVETMYTIGMRVLTPLGRLLITDVRFVLTGEIYDSGVGDSGIVEGDAVSLIKPKKRLTKNIHINSNYKILRNLDVFYKFDSTNVVDRFGKPIRNLMYTETQLLKYYETGVGDDLSIESKYGGKVYMPTLCSSDLKTMSKATKSKIIRSRGIGWFKRLFNIFKSKSS